MQRPELIGMSHFHVCWSLSGQKRMTICCNRALIQSLRVPRQGPILCIGDGIVSNPGVGDAESACLVPTARVQPRWWLSMWVRHQSIAALAPSTLVSLPVVQPREPFGAEALLGYGPRDVVTVSR